MKYTFNNWGSASAWARRSRSWGPLSQRLTQRLNRFWRHAIRVFIKAAVDALKSNIDTGMTVASFRPAAAEVRIRNWVLEFGGFGPKKGYGPAPGPYGIKSMAHGELLGRKAYSVRWSSQQRLQLDFTFNIVVYQHLLHEGNANYKHSLDWHSLDKGRDAMINWINQNINSPRYNLMELIKRYFSYDVAVTLPIETEEGEE